MALTGYAHLGTDGQLIPSESNLSRVSVTGVDAKATGATLIGTTENAGRRFYPLFAVAVVRSADTIGLVPTVSVGTNGATYNDILAAFALTNANAANKFLRQDITVATGSVAPNTGIYVNVTIGATATTMTVDVHVFGYYQ